MASKKTMTIKTLRKWEELKSKFSYDLNGDKVCHIRCNSCIKWEQSIKIHKNFSSNWIKPGNDSISKDSIKKHVESLQHKERLNIQKTKSLFGAEAYQENVAMNSSIAKSFLSLSNEDQEGFRIKMNSVSCNKKQRPVH